MKSFDERIKTIKREILNLKTAQLVASNSRASSATATIPIHIPQGSNTWTIRFEDDGERTQPLVYIPNASYYRLTLQEYDQNANTQKIQLYARETDERSTAENFIVISSRTIASITRDF